jgi:5'-nucleotidase/UDP-sugar diphosphatase
MQNLVPSSSRYAAAVLVGLAVLLPPTPALAKRLQILHTNDLHSHFDVAEDRSLDPSTGAAPTTPKGGFAQVQAKLNQLKAEAAAQGMETLQLDAGDFSEGTQYFLAGQGEKVWEVMDSMGYDAVALGNHDYLPGQKELDRIVGNVKPGFPIVAANFFPARKYKNLRKHFKPYARVEKAGVKFGIVGLVTNGIQWSWRLQGALKDPQRSLDAVIDSAGAGNDYVILLSHLGIKKDRKIVGFSAGIDLVVGGHTHTFMDKPEVVRDFLKKPVPIVHAGQHGQVIGRLIVEVEKGKRLKVVSYEQVVVENDGPKDPAMAETLAGVQQSLHDEFGEKWLGQVIGHSEALMLPPKKNETAWGTLIGDAMRNAAGADLSIDVAGDFYGDHMQGGPVTREKLFRFYPRIFAFDERKGWTVWTVNVRGWAIKAIMKAAKIGGYKVRITGSNLAVQGMDLMSLSSDRSSAMDVETMAENLQINGVRIQNWRIYRVAVPEGLGRAIREAFKPFRVWLRSPRDSKIPMWTAMEEELVRRGGVVR